MNSVVTLKTNYRTEGKMKSFPSAYFTDVDKKYGGLEENPGPTDYLAHALASCTLSVIALKANRLGVNIDGMKASVELEFTPQHQVSKFIIEVSCPKNLDQSVKTQLEEAAHKCPVLISLDPALPKEHRFIWK